MGFEDGADPSTLPIVVSEFNLGTDAGGSAVMPTQVTSSERQGASAALRIASRRAFNSFSKERFTHAATSLGDPSRPSLMAISRSAEAMRSAESKRRSGARRSAFKQ